MLKRPALLLLVVAACGVANTHAGAATVPDSATGEPDPMVQLIDGLGRTARVRDSLVAIADKETALSKTLLEELIWQRSHELQAGLLQIIDRIRTEQTRGADVTRARQILSDAIREAWPRYLDELKRRERALLELNQASDAASGSERLAIESETSQQSDRLLQTYESFVDAVLALERLGVDVADQRAYLVGTLPAAAEGLVTRVNLAKRSRAGAGARLSRDASNAELRYAFEAADERFKRGTRGLEAAIRLMQRLGLENTELRVHLIAVSGRITADVFDGKVLLRLLGRLWGRMVELLAVRAPQWLFQGLLIALTFVGFRALAGMARGATRKLVARSQLSALMRSTFVRLSGYAVMLVGLLVILTQLGVQVAPLLAGLGIAGFVVGFAMQNTLSNFAAGGMILGNQPFDVGDEIEVAGVSGVVKRMSLVSTTILTPDNQTLIIPNSTVWGGVIRNRTAQPTRRVDLTFGISYSDDLERAEQALLEVVAAQEKVLRDPAPVIRLHQLADSSVNFVVRAWTAKEFYWDVYWDLTRAVKVRFDRDGIKIPFPQRDLHIHVDRGGAEEVGRALGRSGPAT